MNRELIGRSYDAATYEIKEEAMIRYALATNETNARFLDPGVDGGLIASPIFPVVYQGRALAKPISDPELNIELKRALHGKQDMTFHRPLRAGDILSTTPSIEDIHDKGSGETISIRLRTVDQRGELVEETLLTLFVRGDPKLTASKQRPRADRTFKLEFGGTPEYERYVDPLLGARRRGEFKLRAPHGCRCTRDRFPLSAWPAGLGRTGAFGTSGPCS